MLATAITNYLVSSNVLHLLESRIILESAMAAEREGLPFAVETLSARLDPRWQRILSTLTFSDLGIQESEAAQQALHCLRALENKAAEAKCSDLKGQIRALEQQGNFQEALRLMTELDRVKAASSEV